MNRKNLVLSSLPLVVLAFVLVVSSSLVPAPQAQASGECCDTRVKLARAWGKAATCQAATSSCTYQVLNAADRNCRFSEVCEGGPISYTGCYVSEGQFVVDCQMSHRCTELF